MFINKVITKTKGVVGGRARIRNTRIPVWQIIGYLQYGNSKDHLLSQFSSLHREDLDACEEYYHAHKAEIDSDIAENENG